MVCLKVNKLVSNVCYPDRQMYNNCHYPINFKKFIFSPQKGNHFLDVPNLIPHIPNRTPDAPIGTPDVPSRTPDAPDCNPDTPGRTLDAPGRTPYAPNRTPGTPDRTPYSPGWFLIIPHTSVLLHALHASVVKESILVPT
jgi:hypothetical protein